MRAKTRRPHRTIFFNMLYAFSIVTLRAPTSHCDRHVTDPPICRIVNFAKEKHTYTQPKKDDEPQPAPMKKAKGAAMKRPAALSAAKKKPATLEDSGGYLMFPQFLYHVFQFWKKKRCYHVCAHFRHVFHVVHIFWFVWTRKLIFLLSYFLA